MSAEAAPVVVNSAAPAEEEMYYRFSGNDGVEFNVSEKAIQQSETLSTMVSTMGYNLDQVKENDAIPIGNIDVETLKLVFEWCEHHKGEAIPENDDSVPKNVVIPEFDEKLMEINDDLLFKLICAANYLNIKQLLNVSCKKVANTLLEIFPMAKGKSLEELRVFFLEDLRAIFKSPIDKEAAKKAAQEVKFKADREVAEKNAAEENKDAAKEETEEKVDEKDVQGTSSSA